MRSAGVMSCETIIQVHRSVQYHAETPPVQQDTQRNRTVQQNRRAMIALLILSGPIISICMGLRQSLGLFIRPMTLDVGVSAAAFGFAIALQNIVWGISQPFIGALADKYGPRPVIFWTA